MQPTAIPLADPLVPRPLACRARPRRILLGFVGLLLAGITCGCTQPIKWYPDYPQGQRMAQTEGHPMLLYFWDWLSRDRARVEMQIFSQPQVAAALRRTVNVRLEAGWFRDLARQYDVRQLPTFVLTDSDGVEKARLAGVPTPKDFVVWLDDALRQRGATQPAGSATRPASTQPALPTPATQPAPETLSKMQPAS